MGRGLPAGVPGVKPENEWPGCFGGGLRFSLHALCRIRRGGDHCGKVLAHRSAGVRGPRNRASPAAGSPPGVPATPSFAKWRRAETWPRWRCAASSQSAGRGVLGLVCRLTWAVLRVTWLEICRSIRSSCGREP